MNIKTEYGYEDGYTDYTVYVNGKKEYSVWYSEDSEDNNSITFKESLKVMKLIGMAYKAGKDGEELNEEHIEKGV